MAVKIERWQARDGKVFKTEADAIAYEEYLDMLAEMTDNLWYRDISVEQVAEWLFCNYDMTARLTARTLPKED